MWCVSAISDEWRAAQRVKVSIRFAASQRQSRNQFLIMRKPVIAGNWKMFKTVSESVATALALKPLVANANHCEVIIAPVFTALQSVANRLEGSNIKIAAQNCATER